MLRDGSGTMPVAENAKMRVAVVTVGPRCAWLHNDQAANSPNMRAGIAGLINSYGQTAKRIVSLLKNYYMSGGTTLKSFCAFDQNFTAESLEISCD